jgi:predicted aspartyl protease
LPVVLRHGDGVADVLAFVDTGASHCVFARAQADLPGLDIEAGDRRSFSTAAGPVRTFGHWVTIEAFDLRLETLVYFFEDPQINRNLLGRTGWLDRIRFGLVDHDQLLYLSAYGFDAS